MGTVDQDDLIFQVTWHRHRPRGSLVWHTGRFGLRQARIGIHHRGQALWRFLTLPEADLFDPFSLVISNHTLKCHRHLFQPPLGNSISKRPLAANDNGYWLSRIFSRSLKASLNSRSRSRSDRCNFMCSNLSMSASRADWIFSMLVRQISRQSP
jgi:hypothetical protein